MGTLPLQAWGWKSFNHWQMTKESLLAMSSFRLSFWPNAFSILEPLRGSWHKFRRLEIAIKWIYRWKKWKRQRNQREPKTRKNHYKNIYIFNLRTLGTKRFPDSQMFSFMVIDIELVCCLQYKRNSIVWSFPPSDSEEIMCAQFLSTLSDLAPCNLRNMY